MTLVPVLAHPLALVQPHRTGKIVARVQLLLARNRFADFEPGPRDGEWGPQCAAAARRAQYWLGRPLSAITGVAHQELVSQLAGAPLSAPQKLRRAKRLTQRALARKRQVGLHAFHVALGEVGVREDPPGSNNGPRVHTYQSATGAYSEPWCASFVSWCLDQVGWKRDPSVNWAYCPSILAAARAGHAGLSVTTMPRLGDLVLYDWDNDREADHIEFFEAWIVGGSQFSSIGGNTSPLDASNGGQVFHYPSAGVAPRNRNDVAAFVRIHPGAQA